MEGYKKRRTTLRRVYTECENKLRRAIEEHSGNVHSLYLLCKEKAEALAKVDEQISELWFSEASATEDDICADFQTTDSYRLSWLEVSLAYEKTQSKEHAETVRSNVTVDQQRRFQLPRIELRKFDGNVKNWVAFWGQFVKIHDDNGIAAVDKYQYLVQATVENSKARALVESYPPSRDNYMKAVAELKERFARDDLLIEYYIRSLLHLVLSNKNESYLLRDLYDKLSTQLQALESLGVTKDKYAAMLLPMVESAIPTEVLKAWERCRSDKSGGQDCLTDLLRFIKREVESEERINASREGFDIYAVPNCSTAREPTAACILTQTDKKEREERKRDEKACIWCSKSSHNSIECYKPSTWTLDEKKELLKKKNGCFICLKEGHSMKRCRNFPKCVLCGKRHVYLLCPSLSEMKKEKKVEEANTMLSARSYNTVLQTVLVSVMYNNKKVITRALFDSGAQRSYIKEDIALQLHMRPSSTETISHCLFGGVETRSNLYKSYQFTVQSIDGKFDIKMTALQQKKISGVLPRLSPSLNVDIVNKLKMLNIELSDVGDEQTDVGLLIGADISGYLLTGNIVNITGNFVAIETRLGWCVQGCLPTHCCNILTHVYFNNFTLTDLWDFETLGIKDQVETQSRIVQTNRIITFFRETVIRDDDGRYKVLLPWKEGFPEQLSDNNKALAWKRLQSTTKRLEVTGYLERYDQVFVDWEKESSLTTPVRPVFDASAKNSQGHSLNSCLEKGENLIEMIPKLLIQFRIGCIGITSDIRRAFLQISIAEKHREFLQFLWWKDLNNKSDVITYRHNRVVFGVTCSPFLLAATLNLHLEKFCDDSSRGDVAKKLKESLYVDNCITSVDTRNACDKFIKISQEILRDGRFELRGWVTGPSAKSNPVSVLGLVWDNKQDNLCVSFRLADVVDERVTKRLLLSFAQRIFDPIGYTSPVSLVPKLLLQKCWQLKLDWDTEVPDLIKREYLVWVNRLHSLNNCFIPRRLSIHPISSSNVSLHIFCDACKSSFAACVFLRSEVNGKIHVQLVLAKSRVAPIRDISIPRLELISAVIGVRLYLQVTEAMNGIKFESYFWTDSAVALTWIKKERQWSVFVNNRVKEVLLSTNRGQWGHVPGPCNPADLPSRGCYADKLSSSKWWEGPSWLKTPVSEWPIGEFEADQDLVSSECRDSLNNLVTTEVDLFSKKFRYFSKYSKTLRCIGWIFRFTHNCINVNNRVSGELSYEEYCSAEKKLLKVIQRENFSDLSVKAIKNLDIVTCAEGLLRVKSRLILGNEPENFKYPILLPGGHELINRLIFQKHCMLQHAGATLVISSLREKYWVTAARKVVKNVISLCVVCRRYSSKAAQVPMAQLPENRIKLGKVFEVVGIDLAGPLSLKSGEKCWIVLFTCAVFRAVHLELTLSLSTEGFMMALRRFISRRGRVSVIYTDNGTNFVGAYNLLKDLDWNEIQAQSTVIQIQWIFNAPSAPWWGGFWERVIRSIKDLLRRVLGRAALSYVELETVLCDCEATMNSRPLTYVTEEDSLVPITPNCFLQDLSSSDVVDLDHIDATAFNVRLKYLMTLRDNFRQRFRNEYLGHLIQRKSSKDKTELRVGDVVLMEVDKKRQLWPLGIIQNIIMGRDGHPRVAEIKVQGSTLTRPVQRLYPLELTNSNSDRPTTERTRFGRIIRRPVRY